MRQPSFILVCVFLIFFIRAVVVPTGDLLFPLPRMSSPRPPCEGEGVLVVLAIAAAAAAVAASISLDDGDGDEREDGNRL